MSDSTNLTQSNVEPSMEDILSSIRKVIADDNVSEDTTSETIATTIEAETHESDLVSEFTSNQSSQGQVEIESDVLELNNLAPNTQIEIAEDIPKLDMIDSDDLEELLKVKRNPIETASPLDMTSDLADSKIEFEEIILDESVGDQPQNTKLQEQISETTLESGNLETPAEIGFDESLDLVMDAEASDYFTAQISEPTQKQEIPTHAPSETTSSEASSEASSAATGIFASSLFQPSAKEPTDEVPTIEDLSVDELDVENIVDKAVKSHVEDMDISETLNEMDSITPPLNEELNEELSEDLQEDLIENVSAINSDMDAPLETSDGDVTVDDDMDLVKSLLADLMDEPNTDELIADQDEAAVSEELATHETIAPEAVDLESTTNIADAEPENELANLAQELTGSDDVQTEVVPTQSTEAIENPDDVISLDNPNLVSKLALGAGLSAGVAGVVAGAQAPHDDTTQEPEADAQILLPITAQENTEENIEDVTTSETLQDASQTKPTITDQEDTPMAAPLKTKTQDGLTDPQTQEETGNVFASLSSAVAEKNLSDENGPYIGDLVKEALKPMLQEWLDKNLKAMVQRSVTAEIKRISSGK